MTTVVLAGDWHGDTAFARRAIDIAAIHDPDLFLHVGDCGIWPGPPGRKYLEAVTKRLADAQLNLVVTLGNHDDWSQCKNLLKETEYVPLTSHIQLAPRVGIVVSDSITVAHVAGAVSVDQGIRTPHMDWWAEEELTEADELNSVSLGVDNVAPIDLVVCHDAPMSAQTPLYPYPPSFWKPYLERAEQHRVRLENIVGNLIRSTSSSPVLVHGHYHYRYDTGPVQLSSSGTLSKVHGLGDNGGTVEDNLIVLEF